jgi:hypothetical protein
MLGTVGVTPFSGTLVPSNAMVVYAALYAVLLMLLEQLSFHAAISREGHATDAGRGV